MPIAPEAHQGAVRQTWRAALCLAAVAAAVLAAWHAAPGQAAAGRIGIPLALVLAGFAVTRLATAGDGRSVVRTLAGIWAAIALWGLPAMVTVILAVLLAGVALSPPADLYGQAWTALWTAAGASSGELIKEGVYDPATGQDLLMHGWLTGVAAQLAVGWSVAVVGLRRLGLGGRIAVVAGLGVLASLALDVTMRREGFDPQAFYFAPPRAWPFLIGAVAALIPLRTPPLAGPAVRIGDGLAWLGLLALPFYLWVWPLLAFPRLMLARPLTGLETTAALAAALVLALVTHRWVERPLRTRLRDRPWAALGAGAATLAVVGALAATIYGLDGLPGRAPPGVRAEEADMNRRPPLSTACHTEGEALPPAAVCTVPAGQAADVVLWGNSHADHLSPAVLHWAESRGLGVRQATRSGCLPLLRARAGLVDPGCVRFNRAAVAEWSDTRPRVLLVGAAWTLVLEGTPGDGADRLEALADELTHTIRTLRGSLGPEALIVLLGDTPDYGFSPARCHARRAFLELDTARCDVAEPDNRLMARAVDERLSAIAAAESGVIVYRPWDALCAQGRCRTRGANGPWYADPSHMTAAGGAAQAEALARILDDRVPDAG
ncbi:SGNH hydrolase domain-containing protein [Roseibacterium beibuensis]|uniref:SGNH hydrolase domain-containing protein n=1 Tax=[Roseibacterium] beibuensis TaxID=1193142 RepID=UPI00217EDDF0|nr:SGNH hydrolase domain-containing protein [Roseibacterium beibuensis]MCS6625531.1 SGNH hydrolase domain-containing protein [Roseibacterium beibuensis]